jgi:hypothetical protein
MSYEGGGSQGPAGPTGPTGATGSGGFTFSGPTGSILWYDGSGVTGNNGLVYDGFSTISNEATNNYITLDSMGQLVVGIGNTDAGNFLNLYAGNTSFLLRDAQTGDTVAPGNLEIIINGDSGTTGQYLGSDGAGLVTWSTPTVPGTFVYQEITPDLTSGYTWTIGDAGTYYLDYQLADSSILLNSNANVQVTTINGYSPTAQLCWVVTTAPNPLGGAAAPTLRIIVAAEPGAILVTPGPYFLSILVLSLGSAPPPL